ncbi:MULTISPECIES: MFS transporter [unclassified Cupriavidus]|uniref:MFS transporter n=1 Tax=unclassified Cupriavidus TaxID=2640874 RepID=UPI001C0031A0|nr:MULTISPECIES: MFS transporter [unclassified Cupriavidus]MCA3193756.1 MFS transporter [Cupriavidus sp.]MCA3196271.1 MFS transporter [Cupriavidus sp.]MCA3203792.1 MFS transporter [Cupriavidus sp.]MCA3207836.1 MFS transporter [Cupriavidus sp.]MCA3236051.1 MFS transporter [Cupriavidus sp.]
MPSGLVALFAVSAGFSVANVYYGQPLLDALARDFHIGQSVVGSVVAMTQVGCALALLFVVPLGDVVDRRRLMCAQLVALVIALIAVAAARTLPALFAGMLAVGLLGTAMTQGLLAYAASAAATHEQGRVVGAAQSGVFVGLLTARMFAGAVSDLAGWRWVYLAAAMLMLAMGMLLWNRLPPLAPPRVRVSYPQLNLSMLTLLRHDRTLQVRGVLALLMFAVLNIFWSALVLPLSAPPFSLPHSAIGAFGLVGVVGALAAACAGKWVDRGQGQRTTLVALVLLILAWWPLAQLHVSLWILAVGIVLLDAAAQALHVTSQSMIVRTRPEAPGRLIGIYMLFYAVGSGLGAMGTTAAYAAGGWLAVCALGAAVSVAALVFWAATRGTVTRAERASACETGDEKPA